MRGHGTLIGICIGLGLVLLGILLGSICQTDGGLIFIGLGIFLFSVLHWTRTAHY